MTSTAAPSQLSNFRDLGGLSTTDGKATRTGILYRSDSPHTASDEDVRRLTGPLGITAAIDLRSEREVLADGRHPQFASLVDCHHFPIAGGPGTAVEAAPTGERLAMRYLEYLDEHGESIAGAVRTIAEHTEGGIVVHCRVGKDRTGVVIGLVLSAVGVRDEDVTRDFERTTAAMTRILAQLRESPAYSANVTRLPEEMYRSDAATMRAFLDALRERHGGAAPWLLNHGVSAPTLAGLTGRLVGRPEQTIEQGKEGR